MDARIKIVFIINPISGVGKKNSIPPLIERHLDHRRYSYTIEYTQHRGHGREIAQRLRNTVDAIVAVGGDGSVNEIGSALVGSTCALGIIPCGSGNGLARHAKIPLNHAKAIQRLNAFQREPIDTGLVNEHPFLGTCGFGFDAHIAHKFDTYHKRGFVSYIKLVLKEYRSYQPQHFTIHTSNGQFEKLTFLCAVANSSQFGNGFTISPLSDLQDGKFELIFLKSFPWLKAPQIAWRFFKGSIHKSKNFESVTFDNPVLISVPSGKRTALHVDGEALGEYNRFEITIRKKSLYLIL